MEAKENTITVSPDTPTIENSNGHGVYAAGFIKKVQKDGSIKIISVPLNSVSRELRVMLVDILRR